MPFLDISFPGLGIGDFTPPRVLPFTVFGKEIYLYGVVIALGFLLAILYFRRRVTEFGTDFDHLTDAILITVPIAIICARLYYVFFEWEHYKNDPITILYIWNGGLAIYGGVIGAVIGLAVFSKVKKQKLTPYLDIAGIGLLIGQSIGRWGNFFNREAFGAEITDNFFLRMGLTGPEGFVRYWHPTFLYESVWNFTGFLLLHFLSRKRKYDGQVFLWYVTWYGLGRAWIEGLRTDSLYIPNTSIRVSQALALVSCLTAIGIQIWIAVKKKPDGSTMLVRQRAEAAAGAVPASEAAPASEVKETEARTED